MIDFKILKSLIEQAGWVFFRFTWYLVLYLVFYFCRSCFEKTKRASSQAINSNEGRGETEIEKFREWKNTTFFTILAVRSRGREGGGGCQQHARMA